MKTFTRTLNILSLCRQLIFLGICDAFIIDMLLDCISAFQEGVEMSANIVISRSLRIRFQIALSTWGL